MARTEKKTTAVMVRLPDELVEAVDTYRRGQADIPSRPDVLRLALVEMLKGQGVLK